MDDREESVTAPSVYRDLQRNSDETAGKYTNDVFAFL